MDNVTLGDRTQEHVALYFTKTSQDPLIQSMLPQKAKTLEEALADYQASLQEPLQSWGRTIYLGNQYVGDVWCYCIHWEKEPDAMLSFCLFDTAVRGKGVAYRAVSLFLQEAKEKFFLHTMGAFTYGDNLASVALLKKLGFSELERFVEEGRESCYFQKTL
jgi:ribosomal-protein-alanine N-acetyltransferase